MRESYGYNIMTLNYKGERFSYNNFLSSEYDKAIKELHSYQSRFQTDDKPIWLEKMSLNARNETIREVITEEKIQNDLQTDASIKTVLGVIVIGGGVALMCAFGFLGFLMVIGGLILVSK